MGATLTTYDNILKEFWLSPIQDMLNNANVIQSRMEKNEKDVEGSPSRAYIPMRTGRNFGTGARAENGTLPTAGAQTYLRATVPLKYLYGAIQITGQVIKASKSNKGSFLRAVKGEMDGVTIDIKRDVNRQLWGSADGILVALGTTTGSRTIVCASASDMRFLEVGLVIDIVAQTTGVAITDGTARTIASVGTTSFVIDSTGNVVTTSAAHVVCKTGSYGVEMMGMNGIVNTVDPDIAFNGTSTGVGDLQGLDSTTYASFWQSTVVDNGTVPIDPTKMQQAIDTVQTTSGENVTIIVMHQGVRANYVKTLTPNVRFSGEVLKLNGGWKGIAYNGGTDVDLPIVVDRDIFPKTTTYFLNEEKFSIYRLADWDWMDEDGSILQRVIASGGNKDAYQAALYCYQEMGCRRRNAQGRLNNCTVPSGY